MHEIRSKELFYFTYTDKKVRAISFDIFLWEKGREAGYLRWRRKVASKYPKL